MNAQTLLLDSLKTRWDKYQSELKACRDEFSEEAVHDFRVGARRLLASLDLLCVLIRDAKIKKMRRILKDQLDNLDQLRDTQVLLADISENIQQTPFLKPFKEYLQRREKKLMRAARKEIKSTSPAECGSWEKSSPNPCSMGLIRCQRWTNPTPRLFDATSRLTQPGPPPSTV
jgi:CHAD domain